jgi:OmpA family
MRRATGPGKVELLSVPPARLDFQLGALLFNFDFDDATLKREHREWLDAHAVPALKAYRGAQALLNGTASRVGAAGYNRALSQRREEAVKQYLVSRGVPAGRLSATFSGADLSVSAVADDELDRAVSVWVRVAYDGPTRIWPLYPVQRYSPVPDALGAQIGSPAAMGLRGAPLLAQAAPSISKPNMELHLGEEGAFTVTNGIGKDLVTRDSWDQSRSTVAWLFDPDKPEAGQTGKVPVTRDRQVFKVRALRRGRADVPIMWVSDGQLRGFVGATVTVLTEVPVFFHFLIGTPGIATTRSAGDVNALIATLDGIYRGPAGITFTSAGTNPTLSVPGLASPGVRVDKHQVTADHLAIVRNRRAGTLFNVFFVGNFVNTSMDAEDYLGVTNGPQRGLVSPSRCCLLRESQPKDRPIDWGKVLAHEAGHALGQHDLDGAGEQDQLMWGDYPTMTGQRIPPETARRMVESVERFPP